jgi:hypothetical protein
MMMTDRQMMKGKRGMRSNRKKKKSEICKVRIQWGILSN